jgi:hypothetical protein
VNRWFLALVAAALLAGGLLFALRHGGSSRGASGAPAPGAPGEPPSAVGHNSPGAGAADPHAAPAGAPRGARDPLPPPRAPARDLDRERAVRERIEQVIAERAPGVGVLKTLACIEDHCRVEIEVASVDAFRPAFERLQEPGGLADLARSMALENPVAESGDDAGPYLVAFSLEF